ncbi:membrane protein [Bacteroidia bacterium]|nr:membrane protein [Bacteroidia bacterium]
MKILDWYIIRKFVTTYIFAIVALSLIIVVFDTSEKIDDFVEKNAPLHAIIFDYFGNSLPFFINTFSALFTFIAVIFFTSNMAGHTEIVAILSNGVSFNRFLRPYMIVSIAITIASVALSNFVIPNATASRYKFEERYVRRPFNNKEKNIHRQSSPGVLVYLESFNVRDQIGYKFSIEHIEDNRLLSKLSSSYAHWDTAIDKWKMHNYTLRIFGDSSEQISTGLSLDTALNVTGKEFSVRADKLVETMSYTELNEFIADLELQGSVAINDALIEKHKRIAYPMANFILTIIGVTVSSRKTRGGMGLNIGLGIALSFGYILFQRFSEMFVQGNVLTPAVALWIPNILFAIVAGYMYYTTPK